jgi:hypothetical protein
MPETYDYLDQALVADDINVKAGSGIYNLDITGNILLAGISAANIVTAFPPGHRFKILGVYATSIVAPTTASKLATVTTYIGSTAVTGGVLSLTTAALATKGAVLAGSAVTANNIGSATDTITLTGSAVTAFVEGSATITLRIQNLQG